MGAESETIIPSISLPSRKTWLFVLKYLLAYLKNKRQLVGQGVDVHEYNNRNGALFTRTLSTGNTSNSVFSNGTAQYNRICKDTRSSKTIGLFKKKLRDEAEEKDLR